ncbi:MAG: FAD-dependent oxidoreductase [Alphaproteobacteria bacterium]|nr:FAD-dependent oxidoreductase [Alphaproteobacteria bacterium]
MSDFPTHARAVIIGGGVVGCSVAYHLALQGWTDVVLIERKRLTSGTTWHAAGLIGQLRATANMTKLAKYSADLYGNLEEDTGLATGFRRTGSISAALSEARFSELKRQASMARAFGIDVDVITPSEIKARYPQVNIAGMTGGVWIPSDGKADPANIALALAKGARQRGVKIFENVVVTGITTTNGAASGVVTDHGAIAADYVVNCAGLWARDVGLMAGVNVPLQACEHFYVLTGAVPGLPRDLPTLRVPEQATHRMPLLAEHGIATFFNGPESFTPDVRYLLGEAPELRNFYVAAGFNSVGIQSAGGAGRVLAEWMAAGGPTMDLGDVDIRRMQRFQNNKTYLTARVRESLGLLYADHFPHRQYDTARNIRHTPLHERWQARGAVFAEVAGWERPGFFEPGGGAYDYSWGRPAWFKHTAAEHMAIRTGAGVLDMSPFGKFRVLGRDAEAVLQRISANDVAVAVGRCVYTQWLNHTGGIEADLTITRLAAEEFLVVTSGGAAIRDFAWLQRHIPADANCIAIDVTAGEACLAIMGPRTREVLQRHTPADLSNAAFPFATARTIEFGMAHVRAHRITYVGELGWELYVAADQARHVFDTLMADGDVTPVGIHAMDSLRLEKAYRHYGHDISDEDHVLDAGLGFAVRTKKPDGKYGPFIGRDAVLARRAQGITRVLAQFLLHDPEPLLFHNEPVLCDGEVIGHLTSGGYGHHLGAAIGLGYIPAGRLNGRFEIEVEGRLIGATASLKPLYDPESARIRV